MGAGNFGNSGAPTEGTVTGEQRAEASKDAAGTTQAAAGFKPEDEVAKAEDELVAYVAAEEYANSRWLIKPGKPVAAPIGSGTTPGMIPLVKREGDVFAKFVNGVLVTKDPDILKWCSEHTTVCRRSDDPMTKGWATLKSLQAKRANRESLIDTSEMDADEAFPPGLVGSAKEIAAAHAAKAGSAGDEAVKNAETTKESVAQAAG